MKFEKQVPRETREFLTKQLKEYEQTTRMNKEERRLLHEWVSAGHSPYENGDCIYGAGGPVDFISALHTVQEMNGLRVFQTKKKRRNCPKVSNITQKLKMSFSTWTPLTYRISQTKNFLSGKALLTQIGGQHWTADKKSKKLTHFT